MASAPSEIASGVDRFLGIYLSLVAQRRAARHHDRASACPIRAARAVTSIGSTIRFGSTIPTSAPSRRSETRRRAPSTSGTRTIGWPSCGSSGRRRRSGRSTTGGEREAGRDERSDRVLKEGERKTKGGAGLDGARSEKGSRIAGGNPGSPAHASSGGRRKSPGRPNPCATDGRTGSRARGRLRAEARRAGRPSRGAGRRAVRPEEAGRPSSACLPRKRRRGRRRRR